MLKKPYGFILNTIDKETGYFDYMQNAGYTNVCNLEKMSTRGAVPLTEIYSRLKCWKKKNKMHKE